MAQTVIWATSVDPNESIRVFRDFLLNFTTSHRMQYEAQETQEEMSVDDIRPEDREPYYPRILRQVCGFLVLS